MTTQLTPASDLTAEQHVAEAERLLEMAVKASLRIAAQISSTGMDALSVVASYTEVQATLAIAQTHTGLAAVKR